MSGCIKEIERKGQYTDNERVRRERLESTGVVNNIMQKTRKPKPEILRVTIAVSNSSRTIRRCVLNLIRLLRGLTKKNVEYFLNADGGGLEDGLDATLDGVTYTVDFVRNRVGRRKDGREFPNGIGQTSGKVTKR